MVACLAGGSTLLSGTLRNCPAYSVGAASDLRLHLVYSRGSWGCGFPCSERVHARVILGVCFEGLLERESQTSQKS